MRTIILTAWQFLRGINRNTLIIIAIICLGTSIYVFKSKNIEEQDLIAEKSAQILKQEKTRDSLLQIQVIFHKNETIDSLHFILQKHHEDDSIIGNNKLSELDAMRAVNESLRTGLNKHSK